MHTKTHSLAAALTVAVAASTGTAQIIADGQLSGFMSSGSQAFDAFGTVDTSLDYTDGFIGFEFTADYRGETAADGIRLSHWSKFSAFSGLTGGIQETYTVTTDTPGEELVFNAVLRATGNSTTVPRPNSSGDYAANSILRLGAGGDLFRAEPFNGSSAIDTTFGKISADFGLINNGASIFGTTYDFASVDFDHQLIIPLRVTAGEAFPLAFSVDISHRIAVQTDMFDTATVSFDLPSGATITSTKGFGAPIPTPAAATLLGLAGIGVLKRHRR